MAERNILLLPLRTHWPLMDYSQGSAHCQIDVYVFLEQILLIFLCI